MTKVFKSVIVSLSILLLSACSLFDGTPKDWTKGYLDESAYGQVYVSETSPLLKMENTNEVYKSTFSYVTFQGKCVMLAGGGPKIMEKFESLWETEVKDAISDILVTRFDEAFFSLKKNYYIPTEYELDLRLNDLFASIFLGNEHGEGQYFDRFVERNNLYYSGKYFYLRDYIVNYYNENDESVFRFEFGRYYKDKAS